jgi:hypothetical protein
MVSSWFSYRFQQALKQCMIYVDRCILNIFQGFPQGFFQYFIIFGLLAGVFGSHYYKDRLTTFA